VEARERAADAGERVATAINRAGEALGDAGLTAKIKSKMALDDTIRAGAIDVDTRDGVVTLRGRVDSESARARALALARETRGVARVVDQLRVAGR
jgi:hyperosmotically inducible protein